MTDQAPQQKRGRGRPRKWTDKKEQERFYREKQKLKTKQIAVQLSFEAKAMLDQLAPIYGSQVAAIEHCLMYEPEPIEIVKIAGPVQIAKPKPKEQKIAGWDYNGNPIYR